MSKKKKAHRGTTAIALLAVVAALASASVGAAAFGHSFGFHTDASWAEGV